MSGPLETPAHEGSRRTAETAEPDAERPPLATSLPPQPGTTPDRLRRQIEFVMEADLLKDVFRRSPLLAADRRENDAEHSWHLALLTLVLAEYADEPLDVGRVLALVVVHDLVEIYAGDTFVYDTEAVVDQEVREQRAAERLFSLLPADQSALFRSLWDEFEARVTPEARFAKAMDRLQPLLLNYGNRGGTWRTPGVTVDEVLDRKSLIKDASGELWRYAQSLIHAGAAHGWVPPSASGT
ncbi:HD family hydrolase [Streptomyces sp. NPDC006463]|uniref:HD domain-containing protein n=1 Tax=Streptomyces sp. NPDC006463 TaxID=3364746 RepID=UPI00369A127B